MAAAKKHSRKGRKDRRTSFFCFFGGCFGISNKVSSADQQGLGKSFKDAGRHGRTLPADDQKIQMSFPPIVNLSKEIHVVEGEEKRSQNLAPPAHELISNKTDDMNSEKNRKMQESRSLTKSRKRVNKQNSMGIGQETRTHPTKLSHSVSLPLPRQGAGAGGGDEKGRGGGEVDPMVGAVIVMVTLMVMLVWGKMWAVVSTAAWFYFVPRFRANMDRYHAIQLKTGPNRPLDLDSREYKKTVVLQGLLHRNQNL